MKAFYLFCMLSLVFLTSCSKNEDNKDDSNKTLGYFKGMERADYEFKTGEYLEEGFFRKHFSGVSDKYSLPQHEYGKWIEHEYYEPHYQYAFYPSFTFVIYGNKLLSVNIEFNLMGFHESAESRWVSYNDAQKVLVEIRSYFDKYNISATFEIIRYVEDEYYTNLGEVYEIVGILNLPTN